MSFIAWVGGKKRFVKWIERIAPPLINSYHEPFLGSGAVFFGLDTQYTFEHAYLRDINKQLVDAYLCVKHHPDKLCDALDEHRGKTSEEYFYHQRDMHNKHDLHDHLHIDIEAAARLIYICASAFSHRYEIRDGKCVATISQAGRGNRPIYIPTSETIWDRHAQLQDTSIQHGDFANINTNEGDLVYLDPPYIGRGLEYGDTPFTYDDQVRLERLAREWASNDVGVIASNSDTPETRTLWDGWYHIPIHKGWNSNPGHKGKQGNHELLITNIPPKLRRYPTLDL